MSPDMPIHPVILAGGSGVRLWPLSRPWRPKPFVQLMGSGTLLQQTVERFSDRDRFAEPLVICNRQHRFDVAEQLHRREGAIQKVVLEPVPRNTGPAICIAALLLAQKDPSALLILTPSDHFVAKVSGLHQAIEAAATAARQGWIVTFGARPEWPETGYGYIERAEALPKAEGCFRISRFVEKPDLATAESYIASGTFSWNSGMFLASATRLIEEMERHEPAIVQACRRALETAATDEDFLRLDTDAFADQPSLAFDRAVMERTERGAVVPIDIGWSDVGSWDALYRLGERDEMGNVGIGPVTALDSRSSYLRSEGIPIAALGIDGLAVVVTDDAILVCPRSRSQELGKLVDRLAEDPCYASLVTQAASEEGDDA